MTRDALLTEVMNLKLTKQQHRWLQRAAAEATQHCGERVSMAEIVRCALRAYAQDGGWLKQVDKLVDEEYNES